jgi:hypothetical protein
MAVKVFLADTAVSVKILGCKKTFPAGNSCHASNFCGREEILGTGTRLGWKNFLLGLSLKIVSD